MQRSIIHRPLWRLTQSSWFLNAISNHLRAGDGSDARRPLNQSINARCQLIRHPHPRPSFHWDYFHVQVSRTQPDQIIQFHLMWGEEGEEELNSICNSSKRLVDFSIHLSFAFLSFDFYLFMFVFLKSFFNFFCQSPADSSSSRLGGIGIRFGGGWLMDTSLILLSRDGAGDRVAGIQGLPDRPWRLLPRPHVISGASVAQVPSVTPCRALSPSTRRCHHVSNHRIS